MVGLLLLLSGGASAFAQGDVIWEGTQESKLFSLTGPKKIRITTEGVFINGSFKPAWRLSKNDACLYGLSNFPNSGHINTSKAWDNALRKFGFHTCLTIRLDAAHSFKFIPTNVAQRAISSDEMQAAFDAAKSGDFASAKKIWERGHANGNDEATRNLGVMYANGDGVKKDLKKAFEYYLKASEAGNLKATFSVVSFLYNGKGTTTDIPKMARLIEDTYKRYPNNMEANEWIGFIYLHGHAVSKNESRAKGYLEKAKSLGSKYASDALAGLATNATSSSKSKGKWNIQVDDFALCSPITRLDVAGKRRWNIETSRDQKFQIEAKRRGLTCGIGESGPTQTASRVKKGPVQGTNASNEDLSAFNDILICGAARIPGSQQWSHLEYAAEAISRGLDCEISDSVEKFTASGGVLKNVPKNDYVTRTAETGSQTLSSQFEKVTDGVICNAARIPGTNSWLENKYSEEAQRRGLSCGIKVASRTLAAKNVTNDAELVAVQKRAAELEKRLALLEAKDELVQRQIASDNQAPTLTIIQTVANGREGYLTGSVTDNVEIAEVLVDGTLVSVAANGSFEWSGFVPATGKDIIVEAIDTAALSSRQVVRIERGQITQAIGPMFDDLNPMAGRRVLQNKNALALIVGISDYERTDAPAIYADKDAQYFHDYASLKLGIPDQNITTLVNDKAEQGDVYLAVVDWLRRSSKHGKSDVFIFFAGHGLASQDGEQMYLLPFDGRPRLLDKTAILRDELFSDIAAANPRSVTVFLDTCYSGTTRGPDMLIASRPIAIRAKERT